MNFRSYINTYLFILSVSLFSQESSSIQYEVGFTSLQLLDSSRVYKLNSPITDSLHFRPVDLDIWYPSEQKKGAPLLFADLFGLFEQRATKYQDEEDYSGLTNELAQFYVAELGLGSDGEKLLNIRTDSYLNLVPLPERKPLIIYLAGFNGMGFENYRVIENLVENGFVVVSIWSVGRYPGDMTNEMEDMMEQVYDAEFAMEYLKRNDQIQIDFNTIGLLGCSWGGMSAAVLAKRNERIKAFVSFDGTETHYFGENDNNFYANDAGGDDNDVSIKKIHDAGLLDPENENLSYLYFESGNKLDDFTPTSAYHYFTRSKAKKYYLRFLNSDHADFTCIPSILNSSDSAIQTHSDLILATTGFFNQNLKGREGFNEVWNLLVIKKSSTTVPFDFQKEFSDRFELSGQVVDANSKQPPAYVNIGILNKEIGTVTDKEGFFNLSIEEARDNDTIRISMIGFKPIEKRIEEIKSVRAFTLEEQVNELTEVILSAKSIKRKTLGNKTVSKFMGTGFSYDQLGAEMGIKINIRNTPTIVEAFNFNISYNRLSALSIFRLNFYEVIKGKPGKNILNENILVPINPKQTGLISIDLKGYDIVLGDDVIITLEWVDNEGENKKGEGIYFPLGFLTTGTLYKRTSQSKFKHHSSLGVGFNIDVRY